MARKSTEHPAPAALLGIASLLAIILTSLSCAYSLGYLFALDSRFVTAFSLADLIVLFVSAMPILITIAMVFVPLAAFLATAPALLRWLRSEAWSDSNVIPEGRTQLPPRATLYASSFALAFLGSFAGIWVAVRGLLHFGPMPPDPLIFVVGGALFIFWRASRGAWWDLFGWGFLLLYALGVVFFLGNVAGIDDRIGETRRRALPCATISEIPGCTDLLVLGSESVVIRKGDAIALLPRERLRSITSRYPARRIAP